MASATRRTVRVFANGCWDLLHAGHFNAFRQARELAARFDDDREQGQGGGHHHDPSASPPRVELVVGIHSNDTVAREKGKALVMTDAERAELLGACAMVDAVVPDVPYAHITPELLDTVGPSRDQWRRNRATL